MVTELATYPSNFIAYIHISNLMLAAYVDIVGSCGRVMVTDLATHLFNFTALNNSWISIGEQAAEKHNLLENFRRKSLEATEKVKILPGRLKLKELH